MEYTKTNLYFKNLFLILKNSNIIKNAYLTIFWQKKVFSCFLKTILNQISYSLNIRFVTKLVRKNLFTCVDQTISSHDCLPNDCWGYYVLVSPKFKTSNYLPLIYQSLTEDVAAPRKESCQHAGLFSSCLPVWNSIYEGKLSVNCIFNESCQTVKLHKAL